jgi:hypothetical protein
MSNVVGLLNQITHAALRARATDGLGPFQALNVQLTPDGGRVEGQLEFARARGGVAFDLDVNESAEGRYVISVTMRQAPEALDPLLEAFRGALERLEANVVLDFNDSSTGGG